MPSSSFYVYNGPMVTTAAPVTQSTADLKATALVTSQVFSSAGTYTITLTDTETVTL